MKWSVAVGILLGVCLGIGSQAKRGDAAPAPDCVDCSSCAVSTAWWAIGTTTIEVLTTIPEDNPDAYGTPVSDARWPYPDIGARVLSPLCATGDHYDMGAGYRKWTFSNTAWQSTCSRTAGQTSYYGWVAYNTGAGDNQSPVGAANRNGCNNSVAAQ